MQDKRGYIKISRKFFDHPFYKEKREYSKAEAWLDLIQICAYDNDNSMLYKGKVIVWGRGQIVASVRYLQQRWNWKSVDKVFSFLELLRSQNMIETDNEQGIGRITLCKYDDYNDAPNAKRTHNRTHSEQSPNELKEYKEIKKEREARAKSFYDSLKPYLEKYGKEMLREFYDYWSEWNRSNTKMKWELKETWEVSKRLASWAKRDDNFKGDVSIQNNTKAKIKVK